MSTADQILQLRKDKFNDNATGICVEVQQLVERITTLESQLAAAKEENRKWSDRARYLSEVFGPDDNRFAFEAHGREWPADLDEYMRKYPQTWQIKVSRPTPAESEPSLQREPR